MAVVKYLFLFMPFFSFASFTIVSDSWPLKMDSKKSFDVASKCEMLVFIEVFNTYNSVAKASLSGAIKVKNINEESIDIWRKKIKDIIIFNFSSLADDSLDEVISVHKNNTWETLSEINVQNSMPSNFSTWYLATKTFYSSYVKEQIRLAALFPRISSEILQLSKNEIQGHNFPDKNFLLTFDDGPTLANGNTDKLIKVLNEYKLEALFFVLGDNLEKRLKATSIKSINALYGENNVFSHGKIHKSHQSYKLWKESINYTNELLYKIFPYENKDDLLCFRPPYGQRNQSLVDFFTAKNSKIIYWNIDSRDWSSKLSAEQVANREIKLMLLWRKGILLFHDIHAKAQKALPIIYKYFEGTGIKWTDKVY